MSPVVSGTDGQRNSRSLPPRAIGSCTFFSRAIPLVGKIGLAHLDQSLHTNVGYLKSPKRCGTRVLLCDSIPSGHEATGRTCCRLSLKAFLPLESSGMGAHLTSASATPDWRCRVGSNRWNHRPVIGPPVAPHIGAPVAVETAMQATDAAIGATTAEAAGHVIAAATAAAGQCARGQPEASETERNDKNN